MDEVWCTNLEDTNAFATAADVCGGPTAVSDVPFDLPDEFVPRVLVYAGVGCDSSVTSVSLATSPLDSGVSTALNNGGGTISGPLRPVTASCVGTTLSVTVADSNCDKR
eukprot:GABV01010470.1.p2 GENE.GABV01010470.1~~GABV01010470.1.p2  ORF type:complete len:109 (-),score=21.75 GABV01010470.1:2-328(-)